jgi:YidC/Oxa1 family membrane protein insertase
LLDWLYTGISFVMAQWHALWNLVFGDPPAESGLAGLTWVLAIVFLVVTIRLVLFPLFVKQVKSQRAMQELQPEIAKLKKQYGSDRQGMAAAQQLLFKERKVNPLAGCLPILPQIPVFLSLFHVLRRLAPDKPGLYSWSDELTDEAARAKLFGAPISSSFNMVGEKERAILEITGGSYGNIRVVAFVLIVIMCFTTYFTQKQIMSRSGPVEGQAATVQKFMLYGMPLSLFVSGFFFPIGVLLYWFTNNLWTLGQQYFILRKLPPPGSAAHKAKTDAEKPYVDPKTLAPKPGAKPVRSKPGRPAAPAAPAAPAGSSTTAADAGTTGATAAGDPTGIGTDGVQAQAPGGAPRPSGPAPANRGKRKRR